MAAFDAPWLSHLREPMHSSRDNHGVPPSTYDAHQPSSGTAPPTHAAFSPVTLSATTPSRSSRRSTILVHQKSPLLLATPPQITRALAYSHPFILPLNQFVGLLTWSTGDPWQSFLLVCAFWAVVLYGDVVVRWAGPVVVGACLIGGMYGRRYSPLSSSGWNEPARDTKDASAKSAGTGLIGAAQAKANLEQKQKQQASKQTKHTRGNSEVTNTKHQKTLDEIVETLKELTGRCNVLLEPLLEMTDFLSTQRTPTSATTKPALTVMFMRLLIVTPFWIALGAPPWRLITTRRVILVAGTVVLTWHARGTRVSRAILWRSATVRKLAAVITGLPFDVYTRPAHYDLGTASSTATATARASKDQAGGSASDATNNESELTKSFKKPSLVVNHRKTASGRTAGVKFTFIIYENQRRWVGLGWTNNLFAYERPAWTDEHNNPVPPKDEFELPDVEDGSNMGWRWVESGRWRVDGVPDEAAPVDYDGDEGKNGWVYYDNKWQNGRRGSDGWGRWTRRRKWYRDAELVEVEDSHERTGAVNRSKYTTTNEKMMAPSMRSEPALPLVDSTSAQNVSVSPPHGENYLHSHAADDSLSLHSTSSKSWSFRAPSLRKRSTEQRSSTEQQRRPRSGSIGLGGSTSTGGDDEDESISGLGIEVEMELQKQGKEGGQWGIGDEARMNLE